MRNNKVLSLLSGVTQIKVTILALLVLFSAVTRFHFRNKMKGLVPITATLVIASLFPIQDLSTNAWASNSKAIDDLVEEFTRDLTSEIQKMVSNATTNVNNLTASNIKIQSDGFSLNASATGGIISSKTVISNGICSTTLVGGERNNTLSSLGNCNDQLIGGLGADKFICGSGQDVVRDYNSKEGDTLVDEKNCETIL